MPFDIHDAAPALPAQPVQPADTGAVQNAAAAQAHARGFMARNAALAWTASKHHCDDNAALLKGVLAFSAAGGAVTALLSVPALAPVVGVLAGAAAVGAVRSHDGNHPVTLFFQDFGAYFDEPFELFADALGYVALPALVKILYLTAERYCESAKPPHDALHPIAPPHAEGGRPHTHASHHADDGVYQWAGLVIAMAVAGDAVPESVKSAGVAAVVAGAAWAGASAVPPAMEYLWGAPDHAANAAAGHPPAYPDADDAGAAQGAVELTGVVAPEF